MKKFVIFGLAIVCFLLFVVYVMIGCGSAVSPATTTTTVATTSTTTTTTSTTTTSTSSTSTSTTTSTTLSGSWETKASLPTARSALAVGVVENKIYAIGGNAGYQVKE